MPRNRMIKHDFWADEKSGSLTVNTRLMFIGTWNFADDVGVFRGNFAYLKANIFPYDDNISIKNIKMYCSELIKNDLIIEGKFNGESYFLIKNFSKHQKINRPSDFRFVIDSDKHNVLELFNSVSTHDIITDGSLTKEKDKEKDKVKGQFDIDAIYSEYPKKQGKKSGMNKLQSIIKTQDLYDKVLQGAKDYKQFHSDENTSMKFIKQFSTWVSGECWNEECISGVQQVKNSEQEFLNSMR